MVRAVAALSLVLLVLLPTGTLVSGHGMMSFPPPRNALDRKLAPWNGTVPAFPVPFDHPNFCAVPDASSADPRKISGGDPSPPSHSSFQLCSVDAWLAGWLAGIARTLTVASPVWALTACFAPVLAWVSLFHPRTGGAQGCFWFNNGE